jgi:hypothetical protein
MTRHDLGMLGAPTVAKEGSYAGVPQGVETRPGHSGVESSPCTTG